VQTAGAPGCANNIRLQAFPSQMCSTPTYLSLYVVNHHIVECQTHTGTSSTSKRLTWHVRHWSLGSAELVAATTE
jgi:hypothetical protein